MSRMSQAQSRLADRLASTNVAGETVTYRRGRQEITVAAVRGRNSPQVQAVADGRANLMAEPQDWLVKATDINFGDGPVRPQVGDRIVTVAGDVYELLDRDGEPACRNSDPYGHMLRLRTVRES